MYHKDDNNNNDHFQVVGGGAKRRPVGLFPGRSPAVRHSTSSGAVLLPGEVAVPIAFPLH